MEAFDVEVYPTREAWLIGRTRAPDGTPSIAASETAALFGELPYSSIRALYEAKLNPELFLDAESERMYWGRRLEGIIAEELTIRHGWQLDDFGRFAVLRSKQWPWLTATLDRRIRAIDARGPGVAECKNSSFFMREEWNDAGAPIWIQIQGQTQLAVSGYSWGVFPVLLGGCEWRMVEFQRDDDFIAMIVSKAAAFSHHVRNRVPPPVDGHPSTTLAFARRWNRDDGTSLELPAAAVDWDKAIEKAKAAQEAAKEVEALNKNRIREFLGEATYGDLPDRSGRWSWKADKNGVRSLKRVAIPIEKKGKAA
jgi:predicted phage-related endonuclease